jgi:hypothetical protein
MDPDPHQHVTDPRHCLYQSITFYFRALGISVGSHRVLGCDAASHLSSSTGLHVFIHWMLEVSNCFSAGTSLKSRGLLNVTLMRIRIRILASK